MKHFILGSDWWSDCDDAVAIRLLLNLHKAGKISLDGIVINGCMEYSAAGLDGFLQLSGVNNIPIGIDCEGTDFYGVGRYQERLSKFAKNIKSNADAEDPIKLYRKILAQSNEKVTILEIGFPQVLANLLKSEADEFSPLKGIDLVREKVEHLWIMAGKWDVPEGAKEHNFCNNLRASQGAEYLCANWPTPITFLGFEVGVTVITGRKLDHNDFLYQAMVDNEYPDGRCSWDPMLVLLGTSGNLEQEGYSCVYGTARVDGSNGMNYFTESSTGRHRYVKKIQADEFYVNRIDSMINFAK
jgi:hypothetical protein